VMNRLRMTPHCERWSLTTSTGAFFSIHPRVVAVATSGNCNRLVVGHRKSWVVGRSQRRFPWESVRLRFSRRHRFCRLAAGARVDLNWRPPLRLFIAKLSASLARYSEKEESSGAGEIFIARSSLRFLSSEVLRRSGSNHVQGLKNEIRGKRSLAELIARATKAQAERLAACIFV
jgi:hypothetical protein